MIRPDSALAYRLRRASCRAQAIPGAVVEHCRYGCGKWHVENVPGSRPGPAQPRERMSALLDAMAYGLFPADGSAPSTEAAEDIAVLSAGITAVEEAETSEQAGAAYAACVLGLAGLA